MKFHDQEAMHLKFSSIIMRAFLTFFLIIDVTQFCHMADGVLHGTDLLFDVFVYVASMAITLPLTFFFYKQAKQYSDMVQAIKEGQWKKSTFVVTGKHLTKRRNHTAVTYLVDMNNVRTGKEVSFFVTTDDPAYIEPNGKYIVEYLDRWYYPLSMKRVE